MVDMSETNVLNPFEKEKLKEYFKRQFGYSLAHTNMTNNLWTIATWNEDDVPHFVNPKIKDLENIWKEISNTDRNTTVIPQSASMCTPWGRVNAISASTIENILTNDGMNDMARNRTNESSLNTSHAAVGDNNTTELVTDTTLGNELDRKVWSELITNNQTERYAVAFVRSDFTTDVTLREAGGFTAASGVILVFRVTFADKSISTGQIMTLQVSVQHQNGVVV